MAKTSVLSWVHRRGKKRKTTRGMKPILQFIKIGKRGGGGGKETGDTGKGLVLAGKGKKKTIEISLPAKKNIMSTKRSGTPVPRKEKEGETKKTRRPYNREKREKLPKNTGNNSGPRKGGEGPSPVGDAQESK